MDLYKDMRASRTITTALALIVMPPGWSPDGRGLTTEVLRENQVKALA